MGGAVSFQLKAGRKKFHKVWAYLRRVQESHPGGDALTSKSVRVVKRPLYTITLGPSLPGHAMEPRGVAAVDSAAEHAK